VAGLNYVFWAQTLYLQKADASISFVLSYNKKTRTSM